MRQVGISSVVSASKKMPATKNWRLAGEFGIDYAAGHAFDPADEPLLHYPVAAEKAADGSYLIVDELGVEKSLPVRQICRTIRLDPSGQVVFDSRDLGIHDGYGCLLDDGGMALLRRTRWDLLLLSPDGQRRGRIDLSRISKLQPRFISATGRGSFLVCFLRIAGELELAEIDADGRLLWYLPRQAHGLGVVGSLQRLDSGAILASDEFHHCIVEIAPDGGTRVVWGEHKHPAMDSRHLSSAKSARRLGDGRLLIADTHNHRVTLSDADGTPRDLAPVDRRFLAPTSATALAGDRFLVCDSASVVEFDAGGAVQRHFGGAPAQQQWLSFPRSLDVSKEGRLLVADTARNRVVEVANGKATPRPFAGATPLFWPRSASWLSNGAVLIADGRNGRLLEVSDDGTPRREMSLLKSIGPLGDPHHAVGLENGNLLFVDSDLDLVAEATWSGEVVWALDSGPPCHLKDPHSVFLHANRLVISDSQRDRVLLTRPGGSEIREIREFSDRGKLYRFCGPRYAEVASDGTLVVVDTDNNRILGGTLDGALLWEINAAAGSRVPLMRFPRWARMTDAATLLVCDHFNHRVLTFKAK